VEIAGSLGPGGEVCDRLLGGRIVIEEDRGFSLLDGRKN
jgi:hypothetical protein